MSWGERYTRLEARRMERSLAPLAAVRTVEDQGASLNLRGIGDAWSEAAFDGRLYESRGRGGLSLGVVFVRSRDGDTGTRNPAELGGGAVDEHLIYEGLSRVAADGVAVGAGTLHRDAFFTVWRPELVALRRRLNLPRHPAQIVMSASGSIDMDDVLLFNVADVPVYLLTTEAGRRRVTDALARRPWVTAIVADSPIAQFEALRRDGIGRICSVGGRRAATELVDAGLVQDVYLTTTPRRAGEPGTPGYVGRRALEMRIVLKKTWNGEDGVVTFEHGVL